MKKLLLIFFLLILLSCKSEIKEEKNSAPKANFTEQENNKNIEYDDEYESTDSISQDSDD